jgi:hypothetical protein
MVRLPQFLLTIGFGLLLIAAHQWRPDKHKGVWVGVCMACAAGGTLLFVQYAGLRTRSTVAWDHDGQRYVTGVMRTDGQGVMNQRACLATRDKASWDDARRFIDCSHGHPEQIWIQESISLNQTHAVILYCGVVLLYMASIVALLHAMKEPTRRGGQRGKVKPSGKKGLVLAGTGPVQATSHEHQKGSQKSNR